MPRFLPHIVVLGLTGFIYGCANHTPAADANRPPTTLPSQSDVVGTWRLISITEGATGKVHPVDSYAFFMRFYSDGQCATWPVPKEETTGPGAFKVDGKSVSRGLYRVEGGELTLPEVPGDRGSQLRTTADKLWYWNADGDTWQYCRVRPDLEPGRLR